MALRPQPLPPVPADTARVARAAFRRGNPYLLLRDRLGAVFADAAIADLYPRRGQPAYAPWRLALVTLMQFREGLSDRQAADAVRGRIDWKYLLALDLDDPGFDFSMLCEFRARLLEHAAAGRLLDRLLDAAREEGLLKARGRSGPGDRVESPYDPDARFRAKSGTGWTGCMAPLTKTCDDEAPRLVVHAEAVPANVHEAMRTAAIHNALAAKGLAPSEHLVDAAYVSGSHIVAARERHSIELVGPPRPDLSWQAREEGTFHAADFAVDWESRRVRCREGRTSVTWGEHIDRAAGQPYVRVGFSPADCRPLFALALHAGGQAVGLAYWRAPSTRRSPTPERG